MTLCEIVEKIEEERKMLGFSEIEERLESDESCALVEYDGIRFNLVREIPADEWQNLTSDTDLLGLFKEGGAFWIYCKKNDFSTIDALEKYGIYMEQ